MSIILPQLEVMLRRIFVIVNNCEHCLITADSAEYFTTIVEITKPHLSDGSENKLRDTLGVGCMVSQTIVFLL